MKLTPDQQQHLFDLVIAAGRPTDETAALVSKGLAYTGHSRFGDYIRATDKGIAFIKALPFKTRIEHETQCLSAAVQHAGKEPANPGFTAARSRSPGDTGASNSVRSGAHGRRQSATTHSCGELPAVQPRTAAKQAVAVPAANPRGRKPTSSPPLQVKTKSPRSPAAPRREAPQQPPKRQSEAASTPALVAQRKEQQRSKSLVAGSSPAEGVIPNALRVVLGAQVTYYPINTKVPHGESCRVFTRNKLYRTYRLASPDVLADTLC